MWNRGKLLGRGSFAYVSIAKTTAANKSSSDDDDDEYNLFFDLPPIIAVKSAEFSCSRSLQKERFLLHEFQDCPQIIRCYGADASEENGCILYNMLLEFASAGSLADHLYSSKNDLLEDQVRQYTRSVLLGLSYIHAKGFAHCDIKPDNILLVDDDQEGKRTAKISDFGLARKFVKRPTLERKRKKGFKGTLLYMAPESIIYGEYDSKVDIWALGCTVIVMFTKKPARDFNQCVELDEVLDRIINEEVEIPHGLSEDADDFLKKCLIKNPKLRWTADMLLGHPFVSCLHKSSVVREIPEESSVSTRSKVSMIRSSSYDLSSEDIDLIKPRLLLNYPKVAAEDSVYSTSVVFKPTIKNSVSEKSYEFPLSKRRKILDCQVLQETEGKDVQYHTKKLLHELPTF